MVEVITGASSCGGIVLPWLGLGLGLGIGVGIGLGLGLGLASGPR